MPGWDLECIAKSFKSNRGVIHESDSVQTYSKNPEALSTKGTLISCVVRCGSDWLLSHSMTLYLYYQNQVIIAGESPNLKFSRQRNDPVNVSRHWSLISWQEILSVQSRFLDISFTASRPLPMEMETSEDLVIHIIVVRSMILNVGLCKWAF